MKRFFSFLVRREMRDPRYRKRFSGITTTVLSMAALALLSTAMPQEAMAVPTRYEIAHSGADQGPGGWFVYDRETSILSDYWITYDATTYPTADFAYPATNMISASQSGFNFSDQTTAFGLGQNFTVNLLSFDVTFTPYRLGLDMFERDLIGYVYSAPYWSGQTIGAYMYFYSTFAEVGPIEQTSQTSPVPEPSTLLLLGSGLGGFAMLRRFKKG